MLRKSTFLYYFLLLNLPLFAQNIILDYRVCDSLFVCGSDTFFIRVQNEQSAALGAVELGIDLPDGVEYLPGSVSGGLELNVSNSNIPVFKLADIPSGAFANIYLLLHADCAAAEILDAMGTFPATLNLSSSVGAVQVITEPIPMETGLLLISSVDALEMTGERCDTLFRKICFTNTRLGKIGSLHFEDEYYKGVKVSLVESAGNIQSDPDFFSADFSADFFKNFGNKDAWLDLNETGCITERIIVEDCGSPEFTNGSKLRLGWGCGGVVCRYDSIDAGVNIIASTKIPQLEFTTFWEQPLNHCGTEGALYRMEINNVGRGDAENVLLTLNMEELGVSGFDVATFRWVVDGDTLPLVPQIAQDVYLPYCDKTLPAKITLILPFVKAMSKVEVRFEALYCIANCDPLYRGITGNYFYTKPCPPQNPFSSGFLTFYPDTSNVEHYVGMDIKQCLQDGQSYPFFFSVKNWRLQLDKGFVKIKIEIPKSLTFDASCPIDFGGITPLDIETVSGPEQTAVYALFALPLPFDSAVMNFCLRYDCDPDISCLPPVGPEMEHEGVQTIYVPIDQSCSEGACYILLNGKALFMSRPDTPDSCAVAFCDDAAVGLNFNCGDLMDTTVTCDPPGGLPGSVYEWNLETYRLNYGLQDEKDDRIADGPSTAVGPEVRRDRYIPGDTMRVAYSATVIQGGGYKVIPRNIFHEVLQSENDGNKGDIFLIFSALSKFSNNDSLPYLRDSVIIKYKNGQKAAFSINHLVFSDGNHGYIISLVNKQKEFQFERLVVQNRRFETDLEKLFLQGILPKPTLDQGDSILFLTDFKFDFNFAGVLSSNYPDPPLVAFQTAVSHDKAVFNYKRCKYIRSQYSGFLQFVTSPQFLIRPCDTSSAKIFKYDLRLARNNFFPFEVRPLVHELSYSLTVPKILTEQSVFSEKLFYQDGTLKIGKTPIPYLRIPGPVRDTLAADFSPLFADPVDEAFSIRASTIYQPECNFSKPDTSWFFLTRRYAECFRKPNPETRTYFNVLGFQTNHPDLKLKSNDSIVDVPTRFFELQFELENKAVPTATNTWLTIVSKSGKTQPLKLTKIPQNQEFTPTGNIFNFGAFNGFSKQQFKLTGIDSACVSDTLLLVYGWGCAPLTNAEEKGCGRDTQLIILRLQSPELELNPVNQSEVLVCDTSDYFVYEVYNGKFGHAYQLTTGVQLPPGLKIVPGTAQFSWPVGTPFVNISNPQFNPADQSWQWKIDQISVGLAHGGLPGVYNLQQNRFQIRFKVTANCGFVAEGLPFYRVSGRTACGAPSNSLNKPGDPLSFMSDLEPYEADLKLTAVSKEFACGFIDTFSVEFRPKGEPNPGDSVFVFLPNAFDYVQDSYLPVNNAPPGPPTAFPGGFRLPLPPELDANETMRFTFRVATQSTDQCKPQTLRVESRVRIKAYCQTTGDSCAIYHLTGKSEVTVTPQVLMLEITGGQPVTKDGKVAGITFSVQNVSNISGFNVNGEIWIDLDLSGDLGPTDLLMSVFSLASPFEPGENAVLTTPLDIPYELLCKILIRIPAATNCICKDILFSPELYAIEHPLIVLCDKKPVELGIPPHAIDKYVWSPATGIDCIDCSMTTYTPGAELEPGDTVTLTLTSNTPGLCKVEHLFRVALSSGLTATGGDTLVCAGAGVTLTAGPTGALFEWSGPGIGNPQNQSQTVYPVQASEYRVVVSLGACVDTIYLKVDVIPVDTATLADVVICEGDKAVVAGAERDQAGTYYQSIPLPNGCKGVIQQSLVVKPEPKTTEKYRFCAGDTLRIYDTLFTQSGKFVKPLTAFNGCDSLVTVELETLPGPDLPEPDTLFGIVGDTLFVSGPAGFESYFWTPIPEICPDCPTFPFVADSAGLYHFKLEAGDGDGCRDTVTYRIFISPPCDAASVLIPNAFTPNNDGNNDVFQPVFDPREGGERIAYMAVYNRWGEKVFEQSGGLAAWDGRVDGHDAPSDVYVYIIEVVCPEGRGRIWGDISLLR